MRSLSVDRERRGAGLVHRLPLERVVRTLVKLTDVRVAEPRLVDLDDGAEQGRCRELFHGKLDCVRRRVEPPVCDQLLGLAVARGKQLRRRAVIEFRHGTLSPNKAEDGTLALQLVLYIVID